MEAAFLPWLLCRYCPLPSCATSSGKSRELAGEKRAAHVSQWPACRPASHSSVIKWKSRAPLVESLEGYLDQRRWWGNLTPKK